MRATADSPSAHGTWRGILAPGLFLAVSWTWCIGMFLPVLLYRDLGPWSFLVFALPNCVGAGMMGLVLRGVAVEQVVAAHRPAITLFALVTQAFQWFFLAWMLVGMTPRAWVEPLVFFVIGGALAWRWRASGMGLGAAACFVGSLGLGAIWWFTGRAGAVAPPPPVLPADHLAPMAAVCAFGFALCPYLDPTFLRVAQGAPGTRAAAFGVGFLVLFPLMILLTRLASSTLVAHAAGAGIAPWLYPLPLLLHVAMQLGFTISGHARTELAGAGPAAGGPALTALLGVAFGVVAARVDFTLAGLRAPEVVYRAFMGMYALVFPAYVWLVMVPGGWTTTPDRRRVAWLLAAVLVAAPAFAAASFYRQTWWFVPGVVLVMALRWLALGRRPAPGAPFPAGAPAPPGRP